MGSNRPAGRGLDTPRTDPLAGPLGSEPPPSTVFSVSSVLSDSRPNSSDRSNSGDQSNFGDDRSQIAIN